MIPYFVIGNSEKFAVMEPESVDSRFGTIASYTNPTLDIFFSRHGFCLPLSGLSKTFDHLIENIKTTLPDHFEVEEVTHIFFRICDGNISVDKIQTKKDGTLGYHKQLVHTKMPGWWCILESSSDQSLQTEDKLALLGFLKSNPSEEKIEDYFRTYLYGSEITWFTFKDIEDILINRFPLYKETYIDSKQK